ncbi:MAG: hypothetical protein HEQ20_13320 [Aphanizomenon flos-aquae KM1D3_PB]|nr:MAG: hypothetical protein HEQ20_13320 [Aphanizomenon flos-aquae KM1D3_PB]
MANRVLTDFKLLRRLLSCFIGFISLFIKAVADLTKISQGKSTVNIYHFCLDDFCAFALLIPHIKTISQHLAILLAIGQIFCKKVIFS